MGLVMRFVMGLVMGLVMRGISIENEEGILLQEGRYCADGFTPK